SSYYPLLLGPGPARPVPSLLLSRPGRPVGHRPTAVLGGLTGHRQDRGDLLRCKLAGAAGARPVAEQSLDRPKQGRILLATFDEDQALEGAGPASPPDAHGMPLTAEAPRDGFVVQPVEGQQDHAGALREGLGAGARTGHGP